MLIGMKIISMMVHPSRNALAAEQFIREVLKYCDGKPTFIVDNAPWLKQALEDLGLQYNTESLLEIESVYSSFKQRTKYSSIT
jgi:putative transposase